MKDPILYKKLLREVEEGRVTVSTEGDLQIFKYAHETHLAGYWNEINRQARGLIMRTDGTIVARPFAKFFNLGEVSETKLDNLPRHESAEAFEKLDGSCGIGYLDNGLWRLATPGSLSSDQAIAGTFMLYNAPGYNLAALPLDCTPVFEIVYPDNRIVCDYSKDPRGSQFLALLAIVEHGGKEWHQARVDRIAQECGFPRPRRCWFDLRGEIPFADNEEGYVVLFDSGLRVKIKSPGYLRIHRLLNYLSPKGVIDLITGREYGATLRELPPSIAKDFDDIRADLRTRYDRILHASHAMHDGLLAAVGFNADRKTQAMWVLANVEPWQRGLVFALLDGKDIERAIWRLVLAELEKDNHGQQDSLLSRPNIGSDISPGN